MKNILLRLLQLDGVSSNEENVAAFMSSQFEQYSKEVVIDNLGNVICKMPGEYGDSPMIIFAHMDEVGLIVRKVENNGFLRFERVGGVNRTTLQGATVSVHAKQVVKGVIGTQSHHLMSTVNKTNIPDTSQMYIDVGYDSAEEVLAAGIDVGNFVSFRSEVMEVGNYLVSKAMDNRVGCAVLLKLQESLSKHVLPYSVYLVGTVMEEFNIRGILPAVRSINPAISIGIDITPACDPPDLDYNHICLGRGPALTYMNFHGRGTLAGVLPDKKLLKKLEETCQRKSISYQKEVASGVITENAFISIENYGIKVANISIPCRYTHTPIEMVAMKDLEDSVELLHGFITEFGEKI